MKKRLKHPFTLVEILIAFVLSASLLGSLSYFGNQILTLSSKSKKLSEYTVSHSYFERRLNDLFSRVETSKVKEEKEQEFFYTSDDGEQLTWLFRPPIHPIKELNVSQLAHLYLKDGKLYLERFPSKKLWEEEVISRYRESELLLVGVKSLSFEFLYTPISQDSKLAPESKVLDKWPKSLLATPSMVKVRCEMSNAKTKEYAFFIPSTPLVHYLKEQ